jgi:hypothetical protein
LCAQALEDRQMVGNHQLPRASIPSVASGRDFARGR